MSTREADDLHDEQPLKEPPGGAGTIFADAGEDLRPFFDLVGTDMRLASGDTLFHQGDDGDALYLVESGAVEISVVSPGGRKLSLNVMRPGDIFGEIALLDIRPRTASAIALSQTVLRRVRRAELFEALATRNDLAMGFIRLLCERLRWVSDLLEDRTFHPLPVRLAKRILFLLDQIGATDGAVAVSQAELADFATATREGVAKTLATWRKRGWIEVSRGTVVVRDRAALEAIASTLDD